MSDFGLENYDLLGSEADNLNVSLIDVIHQILELHKSNGITFFQINKLNN